MCGRFVLATPPDKIAEFFEAEPPEQCLKPSYNVAPTNDIYTVVADRVGRRVEPMHWGLIPVWAQDPSIGNRMINARAETLATKNAFKHAYKNRRCLIPADGFYEWKVIPGRKRKQPMYISRADGQLMAFAGLWEVWRDPDDPAHEVHSCTIITGEPNEVVRDIHDRMPVILPPSSWDTWLDPSVHDLELLGKLLVPAPASIITVHPVGLEVNNTRNDGAHLIDPVEPADPADASTQATLL